MTWPEVAALGLIVVAVIVVVVVMYLDERRDR